MRWKPWKQEKKQALVSSIFFSLIILFLATLRTVWNLRFLSLSLFFFSFYYVARLAGSQFPDQGSNPHHRSERAES